MSATRNRLLFAIILFLFLQVCNYLYAQPPEFPYRDWVKKLGEKQGPVNSGIPEILDVILKTDSSQAYIVLAELEKRGKSAGKYFIARYNFLKADWLNATKGCPTINQQSELMKKALLGAFDTDDDSLISNCSWNYGERMFFCSEIEHTVTYYLYSVELDERTGRKTPAGRLTQLGSVLYTTREFEKSIYYTRKAVEMETDTTDSGKARLVSLWNTIALCWQKIGNYDSAFHYYNSALELARAKNFLIWVSIVSGNMGQVYYLQGKYELAKPLLEFDYRRSRELGELASAANSLQWVARIHLAEGKKDSALIRIQEVLDLLRVYSEPIYVRNASYAAVEIFKAVGHHDSALKYNAIYNHLNDSIESAIANSRLEIARIKLENLKNEATISNLHKERESEKLKRNFLFLAIILGAIIVILILNRQRQRSIHKQQLALQEKAAMEAEVMAAKEQLNMFRQNIIEKTDLIEKLQSQVQDKQISAEQWQIAEELSHQTILTETDWEKFKALFETIYPGFFMKLKKKAPDITQAEQRMAALTRLNLTSRQMASMLGISPDSVQKSKRRLRQRLHLGDEANLEAEMEHL